MPYLFKIPQNLAQNILLKNLSWWNWSTFQYTGWALCKHCWQNRQKGKFHKAAFVSTTAFLLHLLFDTYRHDVRKYKKISWYTTSMTPAPLREAIKTSGQEQRGESCCSQKFWVAFTFTLFLQICCRVVHFYFSLNMWRNEKVKKGGDDRRVSVQE